MRDDEANAPTQLGSDDTVKAATPPASRERLSVLPIGARLGGRYVVRALLGAGGIGEVYRVDDEQLGEQVALKVVRRDLAEHITLREEVRLAQRVTHRNVCRTFDLEDIDGQHYVKMEYIDGETLAARITRLGRLPIDDVVRISRAISDGLAAAHAEGIVHRDLKPANVMLAPGRVALMDFGLAFRGNTSEDSDLSGTPGYMSPEQLAGRRIDARSDLYALGCVTYEMLTGARPTDPSDLRTKRPETPRWLARAVEDLLAMDPARRPRGLTRLTRGTRTRRSIILGAAAIVALVGLGVGVWAASSKQRWAPQVETIAPIFAENGDDLAISPDGKQLVFNSTRDGRWGTYVTSIDGGTAKKIGELCWRPSWAPDGKTVVGACGDPDYKRAVFELPVDGGPPRPRGPGKVARMCGDRMLVALRLAPRRMRLVWRGTTDETVADLPEGQDVRTLACEGNEIAYVTESYELYDGKQERLLDKVESAAFTPGGHSMVVSRRVGDSFDLFELVLSDKSLHRITTAADARAVTVSPNGKLVAFDRDVTTWALFEHGDNRRDQITSEVRKLRQPRLAPDASAIVAADELSNTIVIIDLAARTTRELAPGSLPFFSRDGARVIYVDDKRLLSIPREGGPAKELARLDQAIIAGVDAADGIHLELAAGNGSRAVIVAPDGTIKDEGGAGLVLPSPNLKWRAVLTRGVDRFMLHVGNIDREMHDGMPTWITDDELCYCTRGACRRLNAATGEDRVTVSVTGADADTTWMTPAATCDRWFTSRSDARVTRKKIVNFASRPWASW